MKKNKILQLFAVAALCSVQAGAQTMDFDSLPSVAEIAAIAGRTTVPAPRRPAPRVRAPKEWTIMVFMNGKNNLSGYTVKDLNEMEQVGSSDKINIVVEAGRTAPSTAHYPTPGYPGDYPWGGGGVVPHPGWPNPYWDQPSYMVRGTTGTPASSSWTGIRRYYVMKDADTSTIGSQLIEEFPKADMGDWNHLVEFALWAKAKYPAKKYMLIVWNHGDGWVIKGPQSSFDRGISYDDETGNGINTVQLGQALAKMGGVNIYASDACLMQMAEVIYELKNYAPVIVGSEETEPGDGWDYSAFLSRINPSNLAPEAVAKAAVEGYSASYAAKGKGVTMSAVRSSEAEPLRILTDQWVGLAMAQDKAKLKEALNEAKSFTSADSRDFLHFLSLAGVKLPALKAKGAEISTLVSTRMLIRNAPFGDAYKNAGGLAIYLPSYGYDAKYSKLALSKSGKWDEFMQWLNAK